MASKPTLKEVLLLVEDLPDEVELVLAAVTPKGVYTWLGGSNALHLAGLVKQLEASLITVLQQPGNEVH